MSCKELLDVPLEQGTWPHVPCLAAHEPWWMKHVEGPRYSALPRFHTFAFVVDIILKVYFIIFVFIQQTFTN